MKICSVGGIKNAFIDSDIPEKMLNSFFDRRNLFDNLSINKFYTYDVDKSIYIGEDDVKKLCLLFKLKTGADFNLSKIKFKAKNKANEYTTNSYKEFQLLIVEHYKNPILVEKHKKRKEEKNKLKIHNQEFSKNFSNYGIDINGKKIVSIDFEFDPSKLSYNRYNMKYCSECGVTIHHNDVSNYYHFYIEDGSHKTGSAKKLVDKFEFGETKKVNSLELIEILKEFFKDADFFLAHGMATEYIILEKNGIDISRNNTQILDTKKMFEKLDTDKVLNSYRLKDIIRACEMNDVNVHNAGNDSAYTLKTFLEMNKRPEEIKLKIKELAVHYDKTKTKRPTFKM